MTAAVNKICIGLLSAAFIVAVAASSYLQEPAWLFVPFALLGGMALLQYPALLLYVLLASIPWSIEFSFNKSLGTDLPDEPLMVLTAFAAIILMIAQRNKHGGKKQWHPLLFLVLLQFIWTLVTVACSSDVALSLKYALAKSWYLLAFVAAPVQLFKDEKILRRSAVILLTSMMLFMFVALVRHAQNGWTFAKINDSLKPFYRNHVNYSALLVIMVPLLVAVMRICSSKKLRTLLTFLIVVTVGALYFSYARGAWLALITGIASYWLIKKRLLFFSFLFFMAFCFFSLLWLKRNDRYLHFSNDFKSTIFHKDFEEHLVATYQMKDVSTAERFYRWVAGVRMTKDSWATGFGPNTFYQHYRSYAQPAFKTWVSKNNEHSTVHNYFLLMLIEQGAIGLLLFIALVGGMFWYAQSVYHRSGNKFWKVTVAAAAAILMMECTVNFLSDMIEADKVGSIFYLCLAVIVTADQMNRTGPPHTSLLK